MKRDRDDRPSGLLPTDEYSVEYERLQGHPENVEAVSTTNLKDFYGNLATWHITSIRDAHGRTTVFLLRSSATRSLRVVLPPEIASVIARQHGSISDRTRSRGARKAAATREAAGFEPFVKKAKA